MLCSWETGFIIYHKKRYIAYYLPFCNVTPEKFLEKLSCILCSVRNFFVVGKFFINSWIKIAFRYWTAIYFRLTSSEDVHHTVRFVTIRHKNLPGKRKSPKNASLGVITLPPQYLPQYSLNGPQTIPQNVSGQLSMTKTKERAPPSDSTPLQCTV